MRIKHNGDIEVGTDIGSPVFSSGFAGSGWRYDASDKELTLDNLTVRGRMSVYELLIQQIRASNGSIWVTDAMKIDEVVDETTFWTITIDTDGGSRSIPFQAGDIIKCQRWTGRSVKSTILVVDSVGLGGVEFIAQKASQIGDDPEIGDEFVRIGNTTDASRRGALYLTASDADNPYMDVINGLATTTGSFTTKARIGKLDGITDTDAGLSGTQTNYYGLYTDNGHFKGHIFSQSGNIGGWSITTNQLNKDGDIILDAANKAISINDSTFGAEGIQLQYNSATPRAYIGDGYNNYIKYDGANLSWKAANTELNTSGNLIATSATLSGTVTANDGSIGGWDITSDGIQRIVGDDYLYVSNAEGAGTANYGRGITILQASGSNPIGSVKIVRMGQLVDKDTTYDMSSDYGFEAIKRTGTTTYKHVFRIGGSEAIVGPWEFDESSFKKDTGSDATSAGLAPDDYPFYAGSEYANRASAPFRVKKDGTVVANKFLYAYALSYDIIQNGDNHATSSTSWINATTGIDLGDYLQETKTLRIRFRIQSSTEIGTVYGQVMRNRGGVRTAVGTERSAGYTGSTFTEDIAGWQADDIVYLRLKSWSTGTVCQMTLFALQGTFVSIKNEIESSIVSS
jgi:hypothetical protein